MCSEGQNSHLLPESYNFLSTERHTTVHGGGARRTPNKDEQNQQVAMNTCAYGDLWLCIEFKFLDNMFPEIVRPNFH